MFLLTGPTHIPPYSHPLSPLKQILFVPYLISVVVLTFLPTWVALFRRRSGAGRIFLANLFLGWTVIGWILALIFAFRNPERQVKEPYICRNCYTVSMPYIRGRQWFFGPGARNTAKLYSAVAPVLSCPRCRAPNPIPLDTPAGREIASRAEALSAMPSSNS
jgi:uncharacterized membrane protein YqaE (UPF0057 family)